MGACSLPELPCKASYPSHNQTSASSFRAVCSMPFHSSPCHSHVALPMIPIGWPAASMTLLWTLLFYLNILSDFAFHSIISVFDIIEKLLSSKSITLILQTGNPRLRDVKYFAQGHIASRGVTLSLKCPLFASSLLLLSPRLCPQCLEHCPAGAQEYVLDDLFWGALTSGVRNPILDTWPTWVKTKVGFWVTEQNPCSQVSCVHQKS